jgi:CPA2 family monovalent cation:H+ antiporter-2
MVPHPSFFRDFAYVFVAALAGGLIARRLRQPLILGYVLGGMLVGPFTPGPRLTDLHFLELLAEIGVILLMYSIGIEFSARDLLRVKWVALLGGPLGILLSIALAVGVGSIAGWPLGQSLTVGALVSVASTMVLSRLLIDQGQLHSRHGSVTVGIALVEDLAVVVMTVLLPSLATLQNGHYLAVFTALGKSALLLIPVSLAAFLLVPRIMTRVARTGSQELYLLVALAIGFATAAATQAVGFSLALGAFLAGMVISESEYRHQTLAQLLPLRDAFVALFFVTIGALINPASLFSNLSLLGTLLLLIIVGKFVVRAGVSLLFGYDLSTALLVGIGLTQIGEFSYVLVQVARNAKLVGDDLYNATLAVSLISIVINALLVRYAPRLIARWSLGSDSVAASAGASAVSNHVVLCGFGRVGSLVGTALEAFSIPYLVIEFDPDIVKALRSRDVPAIYGDPAQPSILDHANLRTASLVVITGPVGERAVTTAENIRRLQPHLPIIARTYGKQDREALVSSGANQVVQPEAEASMTIIRHALDFLKVPSAEARSWLADFRSSIELAHLEPRDGASDMPEVRRIPIVSGMQISGTIGEQRVRERFGVTILTITKPGKSPLMNPSPDTCLEIGDRIRVFGLPEQIRAYEEWLRAVKA